GTYSKVPYTVPPDWSSAAFWFEQVAMDPGAEVFLQGLDNETLQGDREAMRLWAPWVKVEAEAEGMRLTHRSTPDAWTTEPVSMKHVPDLFQPLVITLAAKGATAMLTGLDNLVVKETDRLKAMAEVLRTLGCTVTHEGGTFSMSGSITNRTPLPFDPNIDHRMALCIAPLALVLPAVTIHDPGVVDKSYPSYWDDLRKAGYSVLGNR
ncbi:MAG: hypothetical protein R2818_15230, partial [Flavobacteriales bacterium]